jgi:hypothetical protein
VSPLLSWAIMSSMLSNTLCPSTHGFSNGVLRSLTPALSSLWQLQQPTWQGLVGQFAASAEWQHARSFATGNEFDIDDKMGRPTTPWVRQVISGVDLMRHPKYNKGLAFSESERDRLYLRGLLPPAVLSQEVQLERAILNIRSKDNPLDKYTYLSSLQGRNERLFYR